jgi:hypothetical protein
MTGVLTSDCGSMSGRAGLPRENHVDREEALDDEVTACALPEPRPTGFG